MLEFKTFDDLLRFWEDKRWLVSLGHDREYGWCLTVQDLNPWCGKADIVVDIDESMAVGDLFAEAKAGTEAYLAREEKSDA